MALLVPRRDGADSFLRVLRAKSPCSPAYIAEAMAGYALRSDVRNHSKIYRAETQRCSKVISIQQSSIDCKALPLPSRIAYESVYRFRPQIQAQHL